MRNENEPSGLDTWAVRISVTFALAIALLGIIGSLIFADSGKVFKKAVLISFQITLTGIGIPLVIILRNQNMSKHAKQVLKGKVSQFVSLFKC